MRNPAITASLFLSVAVAVAPPAQACATAGAHKAKPAAWRAYWKKRIAVSDKQSRTLSADGQLPSGKGDPWGGSQSAQWSAEAVLANAVSEMLNAGYSEPNVAGVLLALPVSMEYSSLRPYGDGQTNASLNFGAGWAPKAPPLTASLITYRTGARKLTLKFHRSLPLEGKAIKLRLGNNAVGDKSLPAKGRNVDGDFEFTWAMNVGEGPQWGGMFDNRVAFVQPDGWQDWFPLDFRNVVKSADEMLKLVPPAKQKLGKGTLLDPENVSVQKRGDQTYAFQLMGAPNFGADIHGDRYFPVPGSGIHNEFPKDGQTRITAVGHGNTLVMEKAPAPFKLAYICFEARNRAEEARLGVPSGGGWHEIGDPAETVMNVLEKAPVLFGYANGRPAAAPPSGAFAYGLSDVAVVRKLMPGEALVSAAGPTTVGEDQSGWDNRGKRGAAGRNYHWFAFDHAHDVCAVEWVHPALPDANNQLGMMIK